MKVSRSNFSAEAGRLGVSGDSVVPGRGNASRGQQPEVGEHASCGGTARTRQADGAGEGGSGQLRPDLLDQWHVLVFSRPRAAIDTC